MKPNRKEKISDDMERRLWIASRRYMRGEINMKELEEIERPHAEKLMDGVIALAKQHETWHLMGQPRNQMRRFEGVLKRSIGQGLHSILLALFSA